MRASTPQTLCFCVGSRVPDAMALDVTAFLQRIGDDRALAGAMAELFLDLYPAMLDAARVAVQQGDGAALAQAAHALKGSVGNFGAAAATDAAARLETIGQGGDVAAAAIALRELEEALERLAPILREMSA